MIMVIDRRIFSKVRDNDERSGQNSLSRKGSANRGSQVLLVESNQSIEFVPRPTLEDNFQEETDIYDIHNLEYLTDKILEQDEVEIVMI